jgi:hypothetical protein
MEGKEGIRNRKKSRRDEIFVEENASQFSGRLIEIVRLLRSYSRVRG